MFSQTYPVTLVPFKFHSAREEEKKFFIGSSSNLILLSSQIRFMAAPCERRHSGLGFGAELELAQIVFPGHRLSGQRCPKHFYPATGCPIDI
jgi:hypothetical protein